MDIVTASICAVEKPHPDHDCFSPPRSTAAAQVRYEHEEDVDPGRKALTPPPTITIEPLTIDEVIAESEEEMRRFDEIDSRRR